MAIVYDLVRAEPSGVRRFGTSGRDYVFEVIFARRKPLLVRMALPGNHGAIANATRLSRKLRPLGMPLPSILAVELDGAFPYMVLERLPGVELGMAMRGLADARLAVIAARVVEAQRLAASLPSGDRYGFAALPEEAPHADWPAVLSEILERARAQTAEAGVFDTSWAEALDWILLAARVELDQVSPTPFLPATTTRNVVVTLDGTFSGVSDIDELCFGDPRLAPALTQALIEVSPKPNAYVDHWLAASGGRNDRIFSLYVALFLVELMGEMRHASAEAERAANDALCDRLEAAASERIDSLNADWGMA